MLNLQHQEFAESLEEQINLAREQKNRLDLVAHEVEEIQEEFHQKLDRITKSQIEQDEKVDEAPFAARRATRKVGELAENLEKHKKKIGDLSAKIEKNRQAKISFIVSKKRAKARLLTLFS
jgi:chromosome segregation ATPase